MSADILEIFAELQGVVSPTDPELWLWEGKQRTLLYVTRYRLGSHQEQSANTDHVRDARSFRRKAGLCVRCKAPCKKRECAKCNEKRRAADKRRREIRRAA